MRLALLLLPFTDPPEHRTDVKMQRAEPDNYDWAETRKIALSDSNDPARELEKNASDVDLDAEKKDEPTGATLPAAESDRNEQDAEAAVGDETTGADTAPKYDLAYLQRVFVRACWISGIFSLCIAILIPIPMFASHYVFSRRFFEVWCGCVCLSPSAPSCQVTDADTTMTSLSLVWVLLAGFFCMCVELSSSGPCTFLEADSRARTGFFRSSSRAKRCSSSPARPCASSWAARTRSTWLPKVVLCPFSVPLSRLCPRYKARLYVPFWSTPVQSKAFKATNCLDLHSASCEDARTCTAQCERATMLLDER